MKEKELSINDIARICGVSSATVSRVINNKGHTSEETRKRILNAIKENNFSPNIMASGLRSKSRIIGIVVPNVSYEFFSQVIYRIEKVFSYSNYACVVFNSCESVDMEKKCYEMANRMNVAGLVVIDGNIDLRKTMPKTPVVYINTLYFSNDIPNDITYISPNYYKIGYLAGEEFAKKNIKNVLYISPTRVNNVTRDKKQGFVDACKEFNLNLLDICCYTRETIYDGFKSYLSELNERIDGVFCSNGWIATSTNMILSEAGYRVPDDISVIGTATNKEMDLIRTNSVFFSIKEIASNTVRLLTNIINGKDNPNNHILVDVCLFDRGTVKQKNKLDN